MNLELLFERSISPRALASSGVPPGGSSEPLALPGQASCAPWSMWTRVCDAMPSLGSGRGAGLGGVEDATSGAKGIATRRSDATNGAPGLILVTRRYYGGFLGRFSVGSVRASQRFWMVPAEHEQEVCKIIAGCFAATTGLHITKCVQVDCV